MARRWPRACGSVSGMAKISAARGAAHAILMAVEDGKAHSDDLLREDKSMALMSAADRRLTTALVLGVLRWQIQLDERLRTYFIKPGLKLDAPVRVALRLGAFQLLHLDRIPVHAAIDESVELTKRSCRRSAAGLVNAVLRKMALAVEATEGASSVEGGESLSAVAAHPSWMVERWKRFFGEEIACAICMHDQSPPLHSIRLTAPESEKELADAGVSLGSGKLLSGARLVMDGDVTATAAFREGRAQMQDEGSQLVAEIAAAALQVDGGTILDCCAAPGGKTLILAQRNPGARIVACEASRRRLEQLRRRLAFLGDRVDCRLADATALNFDSEFDVVLADVPCSGTGTLSRNPEIRYRLAEQDLARQAERQRGILASALRAVRPGGRVVYSTCSLEPEENEDVVRAVVAENASARVVRLGLSLDALHGRGILCERDEGRLEKCLMPEGFLRLTPDAFGTDGFFIAMIEREQAAV